jgi:hypothetical protein
LNIKIKERFCEVSRWLQLKTTSMKSLLFLTLGLFSLILDYDQEKEKFKGQADLKKCEENLSIDFGNTDSDKFLQTVNRLDKVEIVWLNPMSNGTATYKFCYLVMNDEDEVGFVKSRDFQDDSKPDLRIYPLEIEDYHFYDAQCFRQTLEEEQDLKKFLREK